MMKKMCFAMAFLSLFGLVQFAHAQVLSEFSLPPNGANERAEVSQWIGLVKITIAYHSPNVHGGTGADRTGHIWGELVKYGFLTKAWARRGRRLGGPAPMKPPPLPSPTM